MLTDFQANPAFGPWALATCVVSLHLVILAVWTGIVRIRNKQYATPEDAAYLGRPRADAEHPDVLRASAAHRNAIENAIPFLAIALLYLLTDGTRTGMIAYGATFVGARVVHSVVYLWGRQPWRTISFNVGVLATAGMAVHVLRALL